VQGHERSLPAGAGPVNRFLRQRRAHARFLAQGPVQAGIRRLKRRGRQTQTGDKRDSGIFDTRIQRRQCAEPVNRVARPADHRPNQFFVFKMCGPCRQPV